MTKTSRKKSITGKENYLAVWIFGGLLFIFLIAVFIFAPESLPEFKRKLLALFDAPLAAFFGFFCLAAIILSLRLQRKGYLGNPSKRPS